MLKVLSYSLCAFCGISLLAVHHARSVKGDLAMQRLFVSSGMHYSGRSSMEFGLLQHPQI